MFFESGHAHQSETAIAATLVGFLFFRPRFQHPHSLSVRSRAAVLPQLILARKLAATQAAPVFPFPVRVNQILVHGDGLGLEAPEGAV
jgi:hypothetical protein